MEFGWTSEQKAYREKLSAFVEDRLPADWWESYANDGPSNPRLMQFARSFAKELAAVGEVVSHWPRQYGGRDSLPWDHIILSEELWSEGEPRSSLYMGSNWVGPAVMMFGTEEQRRLHLGAIARGEVLWCQGFSEPEAGSDLASLRTRAERTADGYVLNGRKIWTSYAHSADWMFVLARLGGKRQEGITCFLVPVKSPGLSVKTIKGLHMADDLHETTFDNVCVPESARLGEEGKGWEIVGKLLHNERVGQAHYEFARRGLDLAVTLLKQRGEFERDAVQAQAASCFAQVEASRLLVYRVIDQRAKAQPPTMVTSMARVAMIRTMHAVANFIATNLPSELTERGHGRLRWVFKFALAVGIAAGAAEIQLNMIAERHLGLPRG